MELLTSCLVPAASFWLLVGGASCAAATRASRTNVSTIIDKRRISVSPSENIVATHERGAYADHSFDLFDSGQAALLVPRWAALAVSSLRSTPPRTPAAQAPTRSGLACRAGWVRERCGNHDLVARLVARPVARSRSGLSAAGLGVLPACRAPRCGTLASAPTSQAQCPGHYPGKRPALPGRYFRPSARKSWTWAATPQSAPAHFGSWVQLRLRRCRALDRPPRSAYLPDAMESGNNTRPCARRAQVCS